MLIIAYKYLVHRETLFSLELAAEQGTKLKSTTISLSALTQDSKVSLGITGKYMTVHCTNPNSNSSNRGKSTEYQ